MILFLTKVARFITKVLLALVIFLGCFELGFELVMRLVAHGVILVPSDSLFRAFHMNIERNIVSYMPACAQYDEQLSYTLKPGRCQFANREYDTTLQINSQGLRDDERSLAAPEVIVLGDSHTMGWGVQQDEAFPQQLEKATGLTVLNAGVPSYGTVRELALLKRLDTSRLRYLLIQYCNNDDDENSQYLNQGGKWVPMSRERYELEGAEYRALMPYHPLKYLAFTFEEVRFLLGKWLQRRMGVEEKLPSPQDEARGAADRFLSTLEKSGLMLPEHVHILVINTNAVEKRDWPFIPALQTRLSDVLHTERLAQAITAIDIPELGSRQYYFGLDDHMNALGHQRVAAQLVKVIREDSTHATEQH